VRPNNHGLQIATGHVYLGHEIAARLDARPGQASAGHRPSRSNACSPSTDDDIRMYTALPDAQESSSPGQSESRPSIASVSLPTRTAPPPSRNPRNALPKCASSNSGHGRRPRPRRQMTQRYAALAVPLSSSLPAPGLVLLPPQRAQRRAGRPLACPWPWPRPPRRPFPRQGLLLGAVAGALG
jgi:hypothetical protein